MDRIPGARDRPPPETALVDGDPANVVLLVPPLSRPRFVHDLDLPAGSVAGLLPGLTDPAGDVLPYGRLAVLDTVAVAHDGAYAILRVDRPTTVGGVGLTPLVADPDAGLWVVAIDRPGDEPVDLDGCAEVPG